MIRKDELYAYFNKKHETRKREFMDAFKKEVTKIVETVVKEAIPQAGHLQDMAIRLDATLDEAYANFQYPISVNKLQEELRMYGRNAIKTVVTKIVDAVVYAVESKYSKEVNRLHPEIDPLIKGIIAKKMETVNADIAQLKKLKEEIDNLIKCAANGDKAYKTLLDLKVSMNDFKVKAYLPAVITLSVDPCVLNEGGCQ